MPNKFSFIFFNFNYKKTTQLVKSLRLAHGGLDVQRLDVLPVLFQQRNQKVNGQIDVLC